MTDIETGRPSTGARVKAWFSFRNIGAVYIWVAIVVIFAIWVPDQFLNWAVWRSLIDINSINAIVAIAVLFPLASGAFDLAVGAEVGLGSILVAWLLSQQHMAIAPAIVLVALAGAAVGVVSGLLIVRARIESIIATLGMSSILLAFTRWISADQQILNLGNHFQTIATKRIFGVTSSTWLMLIIAVVVWYVLERTTIGRRVYATGGNIQTARLAGVRTPVVVVLCLATCGVIASFAGVLSASQLAVGDPTIGPPFLLPAYAAALLGSTQFRGGRYNVPGTVVAIYVLATGIKGLQLVGAPAWIPDLFNGVALLAAVGVAMHQRVSRRPEGKRGWHFPGRRQPPAVEELREEQLHRVPTDRLPEQKEASVDP